MNNDKCPIPCTSCKTGFATFSYSTTGSRLYICHNCKTLLTLPAVTIAKPSVVFIGISGYGGGLVDDITYNINTTANNNSFFAHFF